MRMMLKRRIVYNNRTAQMIRRFNITAEIQLSFVVQSHVMENRNLIKKNNLNLILPYSNFN